VPDFGLVSDEDESASRSPTGSRITLTLLACLIPPRSKINSTTPENWRLSNSAKNLTAVSTVFLRRPGPLGMIHESPHPHPVQTSFQCPICNPAFSSIRAWSKFSFRRKSARVIASRAISRHRSFHSISSACRGAF